MHNILEYTSLAHGFVADGHEGALTLIDYLELGGVAAASIGLIVFTFLSVRKDKKKE